MKKRIISIITALALCLSLCPTGAFALEEVPDEWEFVDEWDPDIETSFELDEELIEEPDEELAEEPDEELTAGEPVPLADAVSYRDCDANGQNWTTPTITEYTEVTSDTTTWSDGWYVVSGNVTINTRITVSGTVHLILTDGCTLDAQKGIAVSGSSNCLTIYAQSKGADMGKLTAQSGNSYSAAIGGNDRGSGGTITINGGDITAKI